MTYLIKKLLREGLLRESHSLDKQALINLSDKISKEHPDFNNSGMAQCTYLALKIKELLPTKGSRYPLIHFFEFSNEYDEIDDDYEGDKDSPFNPHKYYLVHTVIKVGDQLYDSSGFTTKGNIVNRFNLKNYKTVIDPTGDIANKLLINDENNYGFKPDFSFIDDLIKKLLREGLLKELKVGPFDYTDNKLEFNVSNLIKIIKKLIPKYQGLQPNCSIEEINSGSCDNFAVNVLEYFFDRELVDSLFYRTFNGVKLVISSDYSDDLEPHTWIVYDGKHYDAEAPYGVDELHDLPIYKRQFSGDNDSYYNQLRETYSSDKNEIIDFLDNLPNVITLYRGLILPIDDKRINKNNLGVHWSLDKYFVENLFRYESFTSDEDYVLVVIEAEINKEDINIETTIDKRLIKNIGLFWDELTGEMIQNDDMEYHQYSHEDEIIIKSETKPKIKYIKEITIN